LEPHLIYPCISSTYNVGFVAVAYHNAFGCGGVVELQGIFVYSLIGFQSLSALGKDNVREVMLQVGTPLFFILNFYKSIGDNGEGVLGVQII